MSGIQQPPGALCQVPASGRGLPPVCSGAHVGRLSVLCLRGPSEDPHCHAHHHLQQDPGQPQQHVEVRQAVPHYSGEQILRQTY